MIISSFAKISSRERKCGTEVDDGARHNLPKLDESVVIRSLFNHLPRKCTESNKKHAVEASENGDEERANRKRADPFVFIEHEVILSTRENSTCLVGEMRAEIESLKGKGIHLMKYPRMRKVKSGLSDRLVSLNIRGFRGQRLEYYEMLRRLRPKVVMFQETLVKREDWAVTIPGYEVFHDCSREGSNHGVLLGISKGNVAQRIPGIEGKLVVAQAQLNEQTVKFSSFYPPCNSTTERASTKGKLLELLQTWSFDNLEEPCIISGDFNMSNSALGLLLKRYNTGYSFVNFSDSGKIIFGNGEKT
ncbi:hypothetical protein AYI69_g3200 [Smittium culicis]|uniref:Endonuclease/exonuclease/phosphatase domain-containing protein n=1 Tax=Smittium culicis TaxID=133412 RepID=A0A1R1YKA8_9FUNG|nr:hypothetical protein AYI69_g3200 [Smittium culicis]